ncbi:Uncharacterised protein [Mycobacteroides abscessus subsp. abscessus]|nr:Uncharacterised protein [Mycobacteroides abscessus subsp. abscessus]
MMCGCRGDSRSLNFMPSEPGSIFSNPAAITTSDWPLRMALAAMNSAVEPVEQLLLTL